MSSNGVFRLLECLVALALLIHWAIALADEPVNIEYENVIGPEGLEWAKRSLIEQQDSSIESFDEVPERQYMRMEIPDARVPIVQGEYRRTYVPDTINLERRADLAARFFVKQSMPQADYEPTCHVVFGADPPRSGLNAGGGCIWPKFMEALPLMRIMSGNREGLEVDRAWAETILHSIGPDGLSYLPLVGRPWDPAEVYGTKVTVPYRGWFHMNAGRLLGVLAVYYQMTEDPIWLETGKGIVDGLSTVVTPIDDKAISFDWYYSPEYKRPENAEVKAREILDRIEHGGAKNNDIYAWGQSLYTTWVVTGLSQFYRVSHYEPARDLALRLARVLRLQYADDGTWFGHHHCNCLAIHAFCELAEATGEMEWARQARKMYEWAKNNEQMGAVPSMGYFPCGQNGDPRYNPQSKSALVMEPCSIGDMTAIAVKLTRLGMGDYFDDVDAYVRNGLAETQIVSSHQIRDYVNRLQARGEAPASPAGYNYLTDNIADRFVGFFSITSSLNDLYYHNWAEMCCTGNASRALYYAWSSAIDRENDALKVNLLQNRTSPWADIDSYLPYTGRVEIKMKERSLLMVRINDWIDKDAVKCSMDGEPVEFVWRGKYVDLGQVDHDRTVVIKFPVIERVESIATNGQKYRVTFRGADVVHVDPPDSGNVGLYKRDHYRTEQPRYLEFTRFVASKPIQH